MFSKRILISLAACFTAVLAQDKPFWGVAYSSPGAASYPTCGVDTLEAIEADMSLLSQITTRVRIYGADCNQTQFVLDAIQRTQSDLKAYIAVYINQDPLVYPRQRDATLDAIALLGTNNVAGITVGNEFILERVKNGTSAGEAHTALVGFINDFRQQYTARGFDPKVPIGTSEVPDYIDAELAGVADYLMANAHPYFADAPIDQASQFAQVNLLEKVRPVVEAAGKTLYMGEVGWPSAGSDTASLANEQEFIDTFVCDANAKSTGYFYFELIDASWKTPIHEVEKYWGLYDSTRKLKVNLPACSGGTATGSFTPTSAAAPSTGGSGPSTTGSGSAPSGTGSSTPRPSTTPSAGNALTAGTSIPLLAAAVALLSAVL